MIESISSDSEEEQRLAVQQTGWAILHINNPNEELMKIACFSAKLQMISVDECINFRRTKYAVTSKEIVTMCKFIKDNRHDETYYVSNNDIINMFEDYEEALSYKLINGGELFHISHFYKLLEKNILVSF